MSSAFTSGTWTVSPDRADAFVEAWKQFGAWASQMPGAGRLVLTRDLNEAGRFVSFGAWASEDAVRDWKHSPDFMDQIGQVLQHVDNFQPGELGLVATAEDGVTA